MKAWWYPDCLRPLSEQYDQRRWLSDDGRWLLPLSFPQTFLETNAPESNTGTLSPSPSLCLPVSVSPSLSPCLGLPVSDSLSLTPRLCLPVSVSLSQSLLLIPNCSHTDYTHITCIMCRQAHVDLCSNNVLYPSFSVRSQMTRFITNVMSVKSRNYLARKKLDLICNFYSAGMYCTRH